LAKPITKGKHESMRVTTVGQLTNKLYNFDDQKPIVITYQGIAFYVEEITESDEGFIVLSTGFKADRHEDKTNE